MTPLFFPIPFLEDNYGWFLVCPSSGACAVVDPWDAEPVLECLKQPSMKRPIPGSGQVPLPPPEQRTLAAIFCTHHHPDHIGGIPAMLDAFPGVPVFGHVSEHTRIPNLSRPLQHEDTVTLGACTGRVLHVPGHTRGAVAYAFDQVVFTGDTLFAGGCGRLFEGTPETLHASLGLLASLPPQTWVACGHEYTLSNLEFASWLEPDNPYTIERLAAVRQLRRLSLPTVPSPLWLEKLTNPFLRSGSRHLRRGLLRTSGLAPDSAVEVLGALRRLKDGFRSQTQLPGRLSLVGDT